MTAGGGEGGLRDAGSPVELRRLYWVGALTVVAATLGVLVVRVIGVAIVRPSRITVTRSAICCNSSIRCEM